MWVIPVLILVYFLLKYLFPQRTLQTTTEESDVISSTKIEKTGNTSPERAKVEKQTSNVPEETGGKAKVEQIKKESPNVKKKRGKVKLLEYTVLREHRVEMVNKLVPETIIPHLKKNEVIDRDDVEVIEKKCKDIRRKGAETMLDILYNSGSWAFKKLIAALQQSGYQEMAQKLTTDLEKKRNDPQSTTSTKQTGCLSHDEYEVLRDNHVRLVNELDSSVLKNYLFENDLINEDEMEKIRKKEEELRQEGAVEMLSLIYKSEGVNVFPKLLKSLDDAGYDELSFKLDSDLKQKNKVTAKQGLTIDLNSLEFPDYPIGPQLKLETIQGDNVVYNWEQKIIKWKEDDAGKLWCFAMNKWFNDKQFKSPEELEMVVKVWLSKLEEVVNRGCLEIDKINVILDVTETLLKLDNNNSIFHLNDMFIFMKIIKYYVPDCTYKKDIEEFVQTKKVEKQRLLEQQRQVFEKLKHNLEGIFEGKQNFDLLPIDTERCELAVQFHSVIDDVREIWNKLH